MPRPDVRYRWFGPRIFLHDTGSVGFPSLLRLLLEGKLDPTPAVMGLYAHDRQEAAGQYQDTPVAGEHSGKHFVLLDHTNVMVGEFLSNRWCKSFKWPSDTHRNFRRTKALHHIYQRCSRIVRWFISVPVRVELRGGGESHSAQTMQRRLSRCDSCAFRIP